MKRTTVLIAAFAALNVFAEEPILPSLEFAQSQLLASDQEFESEDSTETETRNFFEELHGFFQEAEAVDPAEIQGWTVGRCYQQENPRTPIAALLVSETRMVGGDDGPLFPPAAVQKFIPLTVRNAAPSYYDELTDEKIATINRVIDRGFDQISRPVDHSEGLTYSYAEGKLRFHLKRWSDFWIEKSVVLENWEEFQIGRIFTYCYYYLNINAPEEP